MRVSTRGRYALRLMLDIASNDKNGTVRVKDVAERQGISVKYLEQIIAVLNKAGCLKSVRGPQGGYRLSGPADSYSVGTILRLAEGDMAPVACVDTEFECPNMDDCVTVRLWRELDDAINSVIDKYTLQDLLDWQDGKSPE